MLRTALLTLAVVGAGPASALTVSAVPSDDTVRVLEGQIVMPGEAEELGHYDRYYFLAPADHYPGQRVVEGLFVLARTEIARPTDATPVAGVQGAYVVDHPVPGPTDGGCAIVTVAFDLHTQQLLPLSRSTAAHDAQYAICNGYA